jgi:hypothetical protein
MSATDRIELADREDLAGRAYRAGTEDPAAPAGSVTGPVAPTATASGTHQPLTRASLDSGLLYQWQQRNLAASLPLALRQLEDAGNLDNVRLAIQADRKNADAEGEATSTADGYGVPGGHRPVGVGPVDPLPGTGYRGPVFMDSDIYKTMEAVGWELAHGSRPELTSFATQVTGLLEQAQRPDGYLNSYFQVSGEPRYTRLAWSHEMYCAGHLIQAAVALHRGAGDGRLLSVAGAWTGIRSSRPRWPSSTAKPGPKPTWTSLASSSISVAAGWPGTPAWAAATCRTTCRCALRTPRWATWCGRCIWRPE